MNEEPWSSEPGRRQRRNVLATPVGAGMLAVLVIALTAAVVILPGLGAGPSSVPLGTCGGGPTSSACAPPTAVAEPASTESPLPSFIRPTPTTGPTFTSYIVRVGDTLTSIARTFGTSPRSLAWWNRGSYPSLDPDSEGYDPNHIEPGWRFVLMPGVIVEDWAAPTASPGGSSLPPTSGPSNSPGSTATAGRP
ncbi:MAG: LysM peptidoglycan-binding domain-containing protein [Chloroflexi bacterium]|nr:LysM peptidoglycan-binding domain-containing protein [Chloroflexota bacterium]